MGRDRAAREEAKPLRLFVAVDLPAGAKSAAVAAAESWRERVGPGVGRWVPPENWHVTVAFLGRVWPRLAGWVHERVAEAAARVRPFETALASLGAFPSVRGARVLWIGFDDREGGWARLAREVQEALAPEFRPEKRAFTPHLTLARFEPRVSLAEHAESLEERVEAPAFRVGSAVLYRSHLRRPHAVYEPLRSFPLGG